MSRRFRPLRIHNLKKKIVLPLKKGKKRKEKRKTAMPSVTICRRRELIGKEYLILETTVLRGVR